MQKAHAALVLSAAAAILCLPGCGSREERAPAEATPTAAESRHPAQPQQGRPTEAPQKAPSGAAGAGKAAEQQASGTVKTVGKGPTTAKASERKGFQPVPITRKRLPGGALSTPRPVPEGAVVLQLRLSPGQKFRYSTETKLMRSGALEPVLLKDIETFLVKQRTQRGYGLGFTSKGYRWDADFDLFGHANWTAGMASNPIAAVRTRALQGTAIGFMGITFPDGPIKPGSVWQNFLDVGDLLAALAPDVVRAKQDAKLLATFTLKSLGKRAAKATAVVTFTITGRATIAMKAREQPQWVNVATSGSIEVDVATGVPLALNATGTGSDDSRGTIKTHKATTSVRLVGQ